MRPRTYIIYSVITGLVEAAALTATSQSRIEAGTEVTIAGIEGTTLPVTQCPRTIPGIELRAMSRPVQPKKGVF